MCQEGVRYVSGMSLDCAQNVSGMCPDYVCFSILKSCPLLYTQVLPGTRIVQHLRQILHILKLQPPVFLSTTWYQNSTAPRIKYTCMKGSYLNVSEMCQECVWIVPRMYPVCVWITFVFFYLSYSKIPTPCTCEYYLVPE